MSTAVDHDFADETIISSNRSRVIVDWPGLFNHRRLLWVLAIRDLRVRYKQTMIGAAWALLQPVATMLFFALFMGRLSESLSSKVPYFLYVFSGVLPWTLFSSGFAGVSNSVLASESLISKVYFPRLILPLSSMLTAMVDFVISFAVLMVMAAAMGFRPSWQILLLPLLIVLILMLVIGLGSIFATLNVYYRDFRFVVPFIVQMGLFATPSIYLDVGEELKRNSDKWSPFRLCYANPMTAIIESFRASLLGEDIPWPELGTAALMTTILFLGGCAFFSRMEDEFADAI